MSDKARQTHQHQLLAGGRCGLCAERVSRTAILREAACEYCGSTLGFHDHDVLDALESRRLWWRVLGYAMVAFASFVAGAIPMLQVVVQLLALFILHVVVLRRGLVWLSPSRRILARISMKLFGAVIATMALLVNVAIAPLVGASAFILGAVGPALTALYVEGSLVILRRRLRWEAEEQPLKTAEWALPGGVMVALLVVVGSTVGAVAGTLHALSTADIPTVSEIAKTLLELAQ
ncbi:hypothetical protein FIV42_10115 [Persicimonas caeni]|uniref:Uncharacterized protein n=1 Tax=Persicimonas caeni TaxID=2292766 RepID=A0A4Y6PTH2_PERCE|nr:hypothetical protein [Persicimonas caeni]QDG51075.1 hypothetical protein FIV42_10115 [Persicimonas caeni]QED32296.1 hypothetical protein FRD00_10110 [Persicimonas caeni]